jgi:SAM-dependent methyltransferase
MNSDDRPADRADHWDSVYQQKADNELSWHQPEPESSVALVERHAPRGSRVIDVGGGSSILAGRLAARGYDVTVLDISAAAIERARERIGAAGLRSNDAMGHNPSHLRARPSQERQDAAGRRFVQWIVGDVTTIGDIGRFDLWHDRAVFHFMTEPREQHAYAALAARSVVPGGHVIIGGFGLDGPERCSGLPVQRHDEASLSAVFSQAFAVVATHREMHVTPWGRPQPFFFAVLKRLEAGATHAP